MLRLFIFLSLLLSTVSCSLKGEDVLLVTGKLAKERTRYSFDEEYFRKTKKLRAKNPDSLHAHAAYIAARSGSKVVIAEYQALEQTNANALYKYLKLRAELSGVSFRDRQERKKIVEDMEALALSDTIIRLDALFDLTSFLMRDKKKKRKYAQELLASRADYRPYKILWARQLKANDEALDILTLCKEGLAEKNFEIALCSKLSSITKESAPSFIKKRNDLLSKITSRVLKSQYTRDREQAYSFLEDLEDEGSPFLAKLQADFVSACLSKNPSWLPYEVYRHYYGELSFKEFSMILKVGKINKSIDLKKRVVQLEALANDSSVSSKTKGYVLANLGYAFLNPANLDKSKSYSFFMQSHKLNPGSPYLIQNMVELMLELNKDLPLGLNIVQEALVRAQEKTERMSIASSNSSKRLVKSFKGTVSGLMNLEGRILFKLGKLSQAKFPFLKSLSIDKSEEAAFYLGQIYRSENPMIALDFYLKSLAYRSSESPMNDKDATLRDDALKELNAKYFMTKFNKDQLVKMYTENDSGSKPKKLHSFIGKSLVKEKLVDFKGGNFDWGKLTGKRVILSFWATWCTPCFQEMAVLNKLKKQGKLKNLKIVGVCTDGLTNKRKVSKILKDGGIDFEILLDDGSFRDKYLVSAIPSMFFLDEKGIFIKHKTGYSPELEKEIFKVFRK